MGWEACDGPADRDEDKDPRYIDGEGLMMEIAPGGSRSWKLRVRVDGKRRDFGLGSLSVVTLTEAREKAREYRRLIAQGIDPVAERKKEKVVIPSFRAAAEQVHAEHKASWKNGKHQAQGITTLETYAYPFIGDRLVNDIEGPQIRKALLPIWLSKPETTRRAHFVPLAPQVLEALERAKAFNAPCTDLVFPGMKLKKPLSDMTLLKILRDMETGVTVHGFRSAFRDWVADKTSYPGEVAEAALAHANSNKVEGLIGGRISWSSGRR